MDKPQALTPEVVAILSEIREQAHKYNKAFETFDALVAQVEELQQRSESYVERVERETARLAGEMQNSMGESTAKIDAKIAAIDYVFNELDTIQKIKASLLTLEETFKKNTSTLGVVVENIKTLVVRQVEKETGHLDQKINASNDEFRERFSVVEQTIEAIQDQLRRNFMLLDDEIGQFKGKVQETKYIVDETVKLVNLLVEKAEKELYAKFNEAKSGMTTLMNHLEKSGKETEERVTRLLRDADVTNLSMKVVSLTNQNSEMRAKLSSALWIAVAALLVGLGAGAGVMLTLL
jgi:DNA-binding transcriptional MerR regulator